MKILRWEKDTRSDKIKIEYMRGILTVASNAGKTRENRLRWCWHVERRKKDEAGRIKGW